MKNHCGLLQATSAGVFTGLFWAMTATAAGFDVRIEDLGAVAPLNSSAATAVNDRGDILGVGDIEIYCGLGPLGWNYSPRTGMQNLAVDASTRIVPVDLNKHGEFIAQWQPNTPYERAIIHSKKSGLRFLPMPEGWSTSHAKSINDRGDVLGYMIDNSGTINRMVVWQNGGGIIQLPTLNTGENLSPIQINNHGEVIANLHASVAQSFRWNAKEGLIKFQTGDTMTSTLVGINDKGEALGTRWLPDGSYRAFVWNRRLAVTDIVSPNGFSTSGVAINSTGDVIGGGFSRETMFLWNRHSGFSPISFPAFFKEVLALNDVGQVVGMFRPVNGGRFEYKAFLWTKESGMQDLGTLGGTFSKPTALNNRGTVVGFSQTTSGGCRATAWRIVRKGADFRKSERRPH